MLKLCSPPYTGRSDPTQGHRKLCSQQLADRRRSGLECSFNCPEQVDTGSSCTIALDGPPSGSALQVPRRDVVGMRAQVPGNTEGADKQLKYVAGNLKLTC